MQDEAGCLLDATARPMSYNATITKIAFFSFQSLVNLIDCIFCNIVYLKVKNLKPFAKKIFVIKSINQFMN